MYLGKVQSATNPALPLCFKSFFGPLLEFLHIVGEDVRGLSLAVDVAEVEMSFEEGFFVFQLIVELDGHHYCGCKCTFAWDLVESDVDFHGQVLVGVIFDCQRCDILDTGEILDGQKYQECCHSQRSYGEDSPS